MKTVRTAYETISKEDPEERDRLLTEHLPEVRYIAKRIHDRLPPHIPLEDLVHAGVLGLIDALHKYDPSKNVQFLSYAKFRIRGAILDSLRELDWSPRQLRRKARRAEQALQSLQNRLGRTATEPELAREMGMELESLQQLLGELHGLHLGSLETEETVEGEPSEMVHYLPNAPEQDPHSLCLRSELKALLARAIGELPERDRQVLALYYFEELTMKEVGAALGIGESRVSQIHSAALLRLRVSLAQALASRSLAPGPATDRKPSKRGSSWKKS